MNREKIIRAWKDTEYRAGLNEGERKLLPEHPAEIIEMPETEMDDVAGGTTNIFTWTAGHICTEVAVSIVMGGSCRNFSTGCCPSAE